LAAYYSQQGAEFLKRGRQRRPAAPAEVAALLTKGACASCHGEQLQQADRRRLPEDRRPVHADYLFAALKAYKTDGNHARRARQRGDVAQVKQFKRAELKAMAEYLASLPGELNSAAQSSLR
jgi:cytochrome c553